MPGLLVLVAGPSGAGKDTLIAAAKSALAGDSRFAFPRRLVTRHAIPQLEDHDTMSWEDFATGDFALSWEAHGLGYALPRSVERDLANGRIVIANVSRRVLAPAAGRYNSAVILVTADPQTRAQRLAGRGRESAGEVAARLAREAADMDTGVAPAAVVDNSGALDDAVDAFLGVLRGFSSPA